MARNQETLWNRVDLAYFRRLPPFRALKRWLSFVCAFGAIGWVATLAVRNDERPYDSGPPSDAHSMIARDCFKCHVEPWRGVERIVSGQHANRSMNKACLNCHGTSVAHDHTTMVAHHGRNQANGDAMDSLSQSPTARSSQATNLEMACGACHGEHRGSDALLGMADAQCIRCHAELRVVQSDTAFAAEIRNFSKDHPEFRAARDGFRDESRLKLNHAVHLKPNLMGPDRTPVQMTCADCHRPTGSFADWPYAAQTPFSSTREMNDARGQGAHMQPISYTLHCGGCHGLIADPSKKTLPGGEIPHESPGRIRLFLRGHLSVHVDEHPEVLAVQPNGSDRSGPTLRPSSSTQERLKTAWVNDQISKIERMIYHDRRDCLLCHEQAWPEAVDALPHIVTPSVPQRWLDHAAFNHERHKVIACNECHAKALTSTATADVLLPGIALCRTCHAPGSGTARGADDRCIVCHTYHQPPATADFQSGLTIDALILGAGKENAP